MDREINQRFKRPDETVHQYVRDKVELCQRYSPQMSQADQIIKLAQGLPPDMQSKVQEHEHRIQTTADFARQVHKFEQVEITKNSTPNVYVVEQQEPVFYQPTVTAACQPARQIQQANQRTVHSHSQPPYTSSQNVQIQHPSHGRRIQAPNYDRHNRNQNSQRKETRQCYQCGKFGHIRRDCRSNQHHLN
ncbi:unnamed protein product [Didymodactylos carnosus]|uniref:CCHC-type domain-containing protein n=1 Tax=Didymodactylos carnosus TaxID=1234261 RepID=A0A8S2WKS3_9BILA|nr:unnamed protein product [Didymodactylos carnosus]CAF4443862.1 unnamed protein product [Didymodactylos carnosus]